MTATMQHISASAALITCDRARRWRRLLEQSGLSIRVVMPESVPEFLTLPQPPILFFDMSCGKACYDAVKASRDGDGVSQPLLIALLGSEDGAVSARDLRLAMELGASEILLDESPATAIAARIQFALFRAAARGPPPRSDVRSGVGTETALPSLMPVDHADFHARLAKALASVDPPMALGLIILDLDRFKPIVTRFGRTAGDRLLAVIGARLETAAREATENHELIALARLQTDTFALAVKGVVRRDEAAALAERLLTAVSAPILEEGHPLYLQASAGIAMAPADAANTDDLLRAAHSALAHAKHRAGNMYAFYAPHLAAGQAHRVEIEHRLRDALRAEEMRIYYQPIAEVATSRIIGVEALLRWHHPALGLVAPEQFIAVAEETGLAVALSRWALQTAARTLRILDAQGLPPLDLSINIPPDLLETEASQAFADFVLQTMSDTGLPSGRLILEVTERSLAESSGAGLVAIERLRNAGVRLALDDFGTGYASFAALKRFPVDVIKIDRSFLSGTGDVDLALLRAVVTLAKALGMQVTAEGVEREDQLARLQREECDHFQGYFCAPPMPGEQLAETLAASCEAPTTKSR